MGNCPFIAFEQLDQGSAHLHCLGLPPMCTDPRSNRLRYTSRVHRPPDIKGCWIRDQLLSCAGGSTHSSFVSMPICIATCTIAVKIPQWSTSDPWSVVRTVSLALPITYTHFVVMVTPIPDLARFTIHEPLQICGRCIHLLGQGSGVEQINNRCFSTL